MADELTQSKIYQIEYQKALRGQVAAVLDNLNANQYESIQGYLRGCYEDGFIGTLYNLNRSGIPLILPIDPQQTVDAVMLDSKISEGMYSKLGHNIKELKKNISSEISRGLGTAMSYADIARNLQNRSNITLNQSLNIVQTEGHRIQNRSALDSAEKAKEKGADVVKVWDSTLDGKTRPHHRQLDGQVKEIDENFEINGITASSPGHFGSPSEDCRCRCAMLIKPRWDVDSEFTKHDNETGELLEFKGVKSYEEFKKKYWETVDKYGEGGIIKESQAHKFVKEQCKANNVEHKPVHKLSKPLSSDEIVERLAGGDMTKGSCSSLAFAYIGNKNGLDVIDFRGGTSQSVFSTNGNIKKMLELPGIKGSVVKVKKEISGTMEILKTLEQNKEYYLATGKHAAIVRKIDENVEYLELQSKIENGWMPFDRYGSMASTLKKRFGCRKTIDKSFGMVWERTVILMDVDSFNGSTEFKQILGYINTATDKQRKGVMGNVK